MAAIEVKGLSKTFRAKVKQPGLWNSIKSLFSPKYKMVRAVSNIHFAIKKGELVGFIGPNGAGKSTTIKMMTGILHPNKGKVRVLGFDPVEKRQELAYHIGAIFGQRQQLLYHLPAADSFELFARIYELDHKEFVARRDELIEKFAISSFVNTPVRKLSLGQRMRCEFVASLLHNPEVLFLDEPTIGLDIIAKQRVRELIREQNKEEKTTIILTTHDLDDIEALCSRVIIINKGKVLYDGKTHALRNKIKTKIVELHLSEPPKNLPSMPGVKILQHTPSRIRMEINRTRMPVRTVLGNCLKTCKIADVTIEEPPIEKVIEKLYL